ncbi:MAG: UbiA family prenyltransferase [Anaerolineales bacterium]|nr:MAG: UbiA family prenyltransferase [Anaerolineales bacterium]
MISYLKLSRPLHLLLAALTYLLGASIPAYLGKPFQLAPFLLGFAGILLAQASMALLGEVFRPHNEPLVPGETPRQKETLRGNMLHLSIGMIASVAVIAFIIYLNHTLSLSSFLFLLSSIVLILTYSIHPFRLADRGFGELLLALHIAYVIPSIGFLLQAGENHRLLAVLAIPLTSLALAYFLIINFAAFKGDEKYQRGTLLRFLTWERAVPLHHVLVAFTYVMFALTPLLGFSSELIWPAFLTLPFAVFQILQLRAIALGNPPNWTLLTSTALAVFGLTTYFLTLTFWLR